MSDRELTVPKTAIVNLDERRPHNVIEAKCNVCRNEWIGVALAGVYVLECPSCGAMAAQTQEVGNE